MRKIFLLCIYIAGVIISPVYSQSISVQELLQDAEIYDGKTVSVKAEVLEIMKNKKGTWINVSEDGSSIALWLEIGKDLPLIRYTASYHSIGDIVEATGLFQKSAKNKMGELLIDLDQIKVLKEGHSVEHEISLEKKDLLNKTAIGLLIVILLFIIKRYFDGRRIKRNSDASLI